MTQYTPLTRHSLVNLYDCCVSIVEYPLISILLVPGGYGCSLMSRPVSSQLKSVFSTVQGSLTLTATRSDGQLSSSGLVIPFLPPVHLHTKELYLTPADPVSYIEVSATSDTISYVTVKVTRGVWIVFSCVISLYITHVIEQ